MNKIFQPPCAYQGGKQRISKDIVDLILRDNVVTKDVLFYDLCCGSGTISIELVRRGISPKQIVMVDLSPWGEFWKMIGEGTFVVHEFKKFIDEIPKNPKDIYAYIKKIYSESPDPFRVYKFLILQAASFGSKPVWVNNNKWSKSTFRKYWTPTENSNRKSPVNPMMPMPHTLFSRVEMLAYKMKGIFGQCKSVSDVYVPPNSIVYIDPPYKNTTGYGYNFDYMNFVFQNKNSVIYVSEGIKLSDSAVLITQNRKKGGITGTRKRANEEWLSRFNLLENNISKKISFDNL